jgi:hypothetical protein
MWGVSKQKHRLYEAGQPARHPDNRNTATSWWDMILVQPTKRFRDKVQSCKTSDTLDNVVSLLGVTMQIEKAMIRVARRVAHIDTPGHGI